MPPPFSVVLTDASAARAAAFTDSSESLRHLYKAHRLSLSSLHEVITGLEHLAIRFVHERKFRAAGPKFQIVPGPICAYCRTEVTSTQGIEECPQCYAGPYHLACYRNHFCRPLTRKFWTEAESVTGRSQ